MATKPQRYIKHALTLNDYEATDRRDSNRQMDGRTNFMYMKLPADGDGDGPCRRRRALRADLPQTFVVVVETVEPGTGDLCPAVAVSLLFIRCVHTPRSRSSCSN